MAGDKYSTQNYNAEHMARVIGKALPISSKQSIEICNYIKRKNTQKAKKMLTEVINLEKAVPFKRFNDDVGHKKGDGIAAGRYPVKACKEILGLVESVEANAQFKGLSTANLIITHICAQKASRPWHPGRKRRRKMKRTSVEIIVEERAVKETKKEAKSGQASKIKTKTALESKKEVKKESPKSESKKPEPPKKEEKKEIKKEPKVEDKKFKSEQKEKKVEK